MKQPKIKYVFGLQILARRYPYLVYRKPQIPKFFQVESGLSTITNRRGLAFKLFNKLLLKEYSLIFVGGSKMNNMASVYPPSFIIAIVKNSLIIYVHSQLK